MIKLKKVMKNIIPIKIPTIDEESDKNDSSEYKYKYY